MTIDVLKIENQGSLSQDIITLPMTPIINSYFNKLLISWELIHYYLLCPSNIFIKEMCHHQTITVLPKHCPNKLNQSPYTIVFASNMTTLPKGTTIYTTNLQPGELIHMDFDFYNVTSIRRFTSMLNIFCAKTIIL